MVRRTRKRRGGVGLGRGGINSPKIPFAPAQNKPDWMKKLRKARTSKKKSKLKGPPTSRPPPPPAHGLQSCPVGCRPKSAAGGRRRRSRRRRRKRRRSHKR